jgi:hypothetical protein
MAWVMLSAVGCAAAIRLLLSSPAGWPLFGAMLGLFQALYFAPLYRRSFSWVAASALGGGFGCVLAVMLGFHLVMVAGALAPLLTGAPFEHLVAMLIFVSVPALPGALLGLVLAIGQLGAEHRLVDRLWPWLVVNVVSGAVLATYSVVASTQLRTGPEALLRGEATPYVLTGALVCVLHGLLTGLVVVPCTARRGSVSSQLV